MPKKEKLFDLLKTLDKQEKRYVQLSLKKNSIGDLNNYLLLFNAMASQKKYDEKQIKQKLKDRSIHASFAVTKHYLYDHILKALAAYHSGNSSDQRVVEMIRHVNLLHEKKLFAQCLPLIKKAWHIAEAHERYARMIELLDLEIRAFHAMTEVKKVEELARRSYALKKELLQKQEQVFYLQKLSSDNFVTLKTKWVRNEKELPAVYSDLLRLKEKDLGSSTAKILYHQILSAYFFSANRAEDAFLSLQKLDAVFDANPALVYDHFNQYIALLNNMNLLLFDRHDHSAILRNIEKMRAIKTNSVEKQVRVLERLVNVELNVYKNTGAFEKGRTLLGEAAKLLESKKLGEVYRMMFRIDLFIFHFAYGEYRTAVKFLNDFLNESNQRIREDLQKTSRLLNMILHYEMKNYDYFDSLLRSSRRFFKKLDVPDEMEGLFLSFFPKAVIVTSAAEKKKQFEVLHLKLEKLSKQKILHETYFHNFGFSEWALAHMQGVSYAEAVAEKYRAQMSIGRKK